jgi:hypothetical protein
LPSLIPKSGEGDYEGQMNASEPNHRFSMKAVAGALLVLFGLVCLAVVLVSLARDLPIWVLGRRTQAEVLETWLEQTRSNDEGELSFEYFVRYQFTTSRGRVLTSVSTIGVNEWSGLEQGDLIIVVYFPPYPAHNRLDDSRFVPIYACTYVPTVVLGWAGLVFGWRLLQPALAHLRQKRTPTR